MRVLVAQSLQTSILLSSGNVMLRSPGVTIHAILIWYLMPSQLIYFSAPIPEEQA